MINLNYEDYDIDVFQDNSYSLKSMDNTRCYNFIYGCTANTNNEDFLYAPQYGVVLKDLDGSERSAILLAESGTGGSPHEKSAIIDENRLVVILGEWIFCLSIPDLKLNWYVKCTDCVTCFEVYLVNDFYIVHGECSILRINRQGKIDWEYTVRDIFTTVDGKDVFYFDGDRIFVKDWQEYTYILSFDGKLLK